MAIARGLGGWELHELRPTGGADLRGLVVAPERPPRLDEQAQRLLQNYLRYALARDAFLASVHLEMLEGDEGTVAEWTLAALRSLGATVAARAAIRTKLEGEEGVVLTVDDIERGIRATDQDWLDRPTWGERF